LNKDENLTFLALSNTKLTRFSPVISPSKATGSSLFNVNNLMLGKVVIEN
jgi:hypothetical protein